MPTSPSLSTRKHPHAKCEECPLLKRPMVATDARGANGPVDVMWVGEAPAQNEVVQGYGQVGDAGQLLWQVGAHYGLKRNIRTIVTSSVLCRPLGKNPNQAEIDCCRPRLMEEIRQYEPKVVVALGNYALGTLTDQPVAKVRITKERGKILTRGAGDPSGGTRLLATLNPASLLYNADAFPDFERDISRVAAIVDGSYIGPAESGLPREQDLATVPELKDFLDLVEHDRDFRMNATYEGGALLEASADLETGGFDYSVGGDEILCLSMAFDNTLGWVVTEEMMAHPDAKPLLQRLFLNKEIAWTWQNGTFDANFLERDIGYFAITHDTLLLHYAVDERRATHSLERMSAEYENAPDYKSWVDEHLKSTDGSYRNIPRDVLYLYAAYDAVYTRRLRFTLEKLARKDTV